MKLMTILLSSLFFFRSSTRSWKFFSKQLQFQKQFLHQNQKHVSAKLSSSSLWASSIEVTETYQQTKINPSLVELRNRIESAPEQPGIYIFRDQFGKLLYIGKSVNLKQRIKSYFKNLPLIKNLIYDSEVTQFEPASSLGKRQSTMVSLIRSVETIVTFDAGEALMLEASLVRVRQPPFNVLLKDDSTHYSYLCITWSKQYPEFYITSTKFQSSYQSILNQNLKLSKKFKSNSTSSSFPQQDVYLGPFVEGNALRSLLLAVKECFLLRQRFFPLYHDRTCLNYEIGRCPGVCQKLIKSNDYKKTIAEVQMVFEGQSHLLLSKLEQRLQAAVDNEAFEIADNIDRQIGRLRKTGLLGSALPFDCDQYQEGPTCDVWAVSSSRDGGQIGLTREGTNPKMSIRKEEVRESNGEYNLASVQLFQVRKGRIEHRLGWSLSQLNNEIDNWEILSQVLTQHYASSLSPCPQTILTSEQIPVFMNDELKASLTIQRRNNIDVSILEDIKNDDDDKKAIQVNIFCPLFPNNKTNDQDVEKKEEENEKSCKKEEANKDHGPQFHSDNVHLINLVLHNAQSELIRIGGRNLVIKTALQDMAKYLNVKWKSNTEINDKISNSELDRKKELSNDKDDDDDDDDDDDERIEGLDISHTAGSYRVASFVVFLNGKVSKRHHKTILLDQKNKFENSKKINQIMKQNKVNENDDSNDNEDINNDCLSIREAVIRRFSTTDDTNIKNKDKNNKMKYPRLLLVDGGKGQLNAAWQGLCDCGLVEDGSIKVNMVLCSIAKKKEEIFVLNQSEPMNQQDVFSNPNSPLMVLLRQIRDEAHRVAVAKHRQRRDHIKFS